MAKLRKTPAQLRESARAMLRQADTRELEGLAAIGRLAIDRKAELSESLRAQIEKLLGVTA